MVVSLLKLLLGGLELLLGRVQILHPVLDLVFGLVDVGLGLLDIVQGFGFIMPAGLMALGPRLNRLQMTFLFRFTHFVVSFIN
jgi:hypothetical protein